ncbi:MAG: U32 family peptidase [Lachnospiraceae bacterium]|nr:U32 family peptidase [Lachnospiraceae bacterium]
MEKPKAELLAPAGSFATLKAVACAGADAVYGAGERFGARAYAGNFTDQELREALDYLHIHGRRFYLTVNTLLKEQELWGMLYDYILPLYRHGLDGVIVQDLGVLAFLGEQFPGLELHASTQMSITGPQGARLMKELGCGRIVPARELSLEELARIHREVDIEIESFIHGALCYCYSGQCLFSSMLGGRSGNRGRCAQPCRLPYRVGGGHESYALSPKDLCTIELLPRLLASGVYSLKIEGRMKQLEYAAGVTGIYRKYLDQCLEHPGEAYHVEEADRKRLMELGSRSGYTRGYYEQRNGPQMMAMEKSAHTSGSETLQEEMRRRYAKKPLQENIKGILKLCKGFPASLVVEWNGNRISVEGAVPQEAVKQPLTQEGIREKLCKTGNSAFAFGELEIQLENSLFLPVGEFSRMRREALEQLMELGLQEFRRDLRPREAKPVEMSLRPREAKPVEMSLRPREAKPVDMSLPPGEAEQAHGLAVAVRTWEQLETVLEYGFVNRIYLESDAVPRDAAAERWPEAVRQVHRAGKELYYVLPAVLREGSWEWHKEQLTMVRKAGVDGFVTGSYEGLGLLENEGPGLRENGGRIITDSSLYVWNSKSRQALSDLGVWETTLPLEANWQELLHRGYEGGELLLYGYLPLMVSAQCLRKNTAGCRKQSGMMQLKDRYGKTFSVLCQCTDCYNVIYNSAPLWLFHQRKRLKQLKVSGYRISFTTEQEKEIRRVLSCYDRVFCQGEEPEPDCIPKDYTNGHLKRGVE